MSTTHTPATTAPPRPTTKQRVGLVLAAVYCLVSLPSAFTPTPDGEVGPPMTILLADTVLAAIGLVAVVVAWRACRPAALRVLAAVLVLSVLTALPAFFVDVPALLKTLVAVSVVWALGSLVLVFSAPRADGA